jgi:hypothetical protein
MAILSANMANLFDARINKAFYDYLGKYPEEYTKWCETMGSTKQYEKVSLYGELPMPPALGEYENAAETSFKQGPVRTWTHVKYGFTLIASEECLEDELFPVVESTAGKMGTAMKHRIETQGAYDLNNAFVTVNTVGASNTADETLIATSHATFTGAGGAAQANRPSTDVTLGADSLWAGVTNFAGLKDHEGNPVMAIPKLLIVPAALERAAIEILKSIEVPYKSTNEINAIRTRGLDYAIGHYLTSTTAWFLVTDQKPIRFYMRRSPTVKPDTTIRNDSRSWTITARMSHAPYDWYQIYGSDGTP